MLRAENAGPYRRLRFAKFTGFALLFAAMKRNDPTKRAVTVLNRCYL